MALRAILGFDHIPNVSSVTSSAAFAKVLGGLPFRIQGSSGNTKAAVFGGPTSPTLLAGVNSGATSLSWVLDCSKLTSGNVRKSWVGYRFKCLATGSGSGAFSALMAAQYSWNLNDTTNRHVIATFSDIEAVYADMLNKEYYIELCIDWENYKIELWIEGTLRQTIDVTAAVVRTAFQNRTLGLFIFAANGANTQYSLRDFYWVDDTQDSTQCDRLGSQIVLPATITVEQSENWTASAGTVNSALNTVVNASTPDTPVANSPAVPTPIVSAVSFSNPIVQKINGVAVLPGIGRPAGSGSSATVGFKDGEQNTPLSQVVIDSVLKHSTLTRAFELAPDGTPWTPNKLNASKLVLTPVVG